MTGILRLEPLKIAYCQVTYWADYELTLRSVVEAELYVDMVVIICDESLTNEQVLELTRFKSTVFKYPWNDNHTDFHNHCLEQARALHADWVIISDADERFNEAFWNGIRERIENAGTINNFGVRCVNEDDGATSDSGFKNLVFKLTDFNFIGSGIGTTHQRWPPDAPYTPKTTAMLPPHMSYVHTKSKETSLKSMARGIFLAGGGDGVGEENPLWKPLIKILNDSGVMNWPDFEHFILNPSTELPKELLDWMVEALTLSASDWGKELRGTVKWTLLHHPYDSYPGMREGLSREPVKTRHDQVDEWVVKCYWDVLLRQADHEGRKHYVTSILRGSLREEDLPALLRASQEYKDKFH